VASPQKPSRRKRHSRYIICVMILMIDVVIPNKNENEFIEIAQKLGYEKLIFLYTSDKNIPQIKTDKIKISFGILTAKGGKAKYLTFMQSADKDQQIIENNPPNAVFGFEAKSEKDYLHQRASGLNNVICTFAQKNKVIIAFSFAQILKSYKTKRAQIFGRFMQNIRLCRKYQVKTAIASFATQPFEMRSPNDMQAVFCLLGMTPQDAKKSFETIDI